MKTENHIADGLLLRNEDEITDLELEMQRSEDTRIANEKYCEDVAHLCHLATELIIHNGFNLFVCIFTWGRVSISIHIEDRSFIVFDFDKGDDVKKKSAMLTEDYLNSFIKSNKKP